jgi:hypothetical protein
MAGYQPNPYPLSPQAQALNDLLEGKTQAAIQAVERARAAAAGGIADGVGAVGSSIRSALGPNEEQALRQARAQAAWQERLAQSRAQPGMLSQILSSLRSPMPAAMPRGALAEILNAQRVSNQNPSVTPPPMIGVRN